MNDVVLREISERFGKSLTDDPPEQHEINARWFAIAEGLRQEYLDNGLVRSAEAVKREIDIQRKLVYNQ